MQDVANEAGVSRALVSLVMRDSPKVSEHRRILVQQTADRLGYRPNAAARNLAQSRSNTIGVILNDLHNPFFADAVDGIQAEAEEHGFHLLLSSANLNPEIERKSMATFAEHRMDAIIVLGSNAPHEDLVDVSGGAPVVSVGRTIRDADAVLNDDERGGELATQHLIELGHTSILHLDGGTGAGADARLRGYLQTMKESELQPWVIHGDYTEDTANKAIAALFATTEKLPTAIFAANDFSAVGVLEQLRSQGVSVPTDISVVGYDNTTFAGLGHVSLTTVNQQTRQMGHLAMRCVLERLNGRRATVTQVLEPELIPRRTTAATAFNQRKLA